MNNVMVDLETLGTRAGCAILSIGAVAFDAETGLGSELYVVVDRASCRANGLHEELGTIHWWDKQSVEARQVLKDAENKSVSIPMPAALDRFNEFLAPFGKNSVKVWGNGSDFDNAILQVAYAQCNMEAGWKFWNNRCFRTIKDLSNFSAGKRVGVHHNALDDAKTQALQAITMLNQLRA